MKITIIVPIYNVEKYIEQCLESILNQTFQDFELILVNDGTKDKSIERIQHLLERNEKIHLINKDNGGLSSARNEGLKIAKGEYIAFVDSDDFLESSFLENLYKEASENNLDVAIGGYTNLFMDGTYEKCIRNTNLFDSEIKEGIQFLYEEVVLQDYRMEVWSNLYKREFLKENDLNFLEGLLHEDEEFTPRMLFKAKRVKLVNTYEYIYRQREASIMTAIPTIHHIKSILFTIDKLSMEFLSDNNPKNRIVYSALINHLAECCIGKIIICNEKNKQQLLRQLSSRRLRKILMYNPNFNFKNNLKYIMLKIIPALYILKLKLKLKLK